MQSKNVANRFIQDDTLLYRADSRAVGFGDVNRKCDVAMVSLTHCGLKQDKQVEVVAVAS